MSRHIASTRLFAVRFVFLDSPKKLYPAIIGARSNQQDVWVSVFAVRGGRLSCSALSHPLFRRSDQRQRQQCGAA